MPHNPDLYKIDLLTAPVADLKALRSQAQSSAELKYIAWLKPLLERDAFTDDTSQNDFDYKVHTLANKHAGSTAAERIAHLGVRTTPRVYNSVLLANLLQTGLAGQFYTDLKPLLSDKTHSVNLVLIDAHLIFKSIVAHITLLKEDKTTNQASFTRELPFICETFALPYQILLDAYQGTKELNYDRLKAGLKAKAEDIAAQTEITAKLERNKELSLSDEEEKKSVQLANSELFIKAILQGFKNWVSENYTNAPEVVKRIRSYKYTAHQMDEQDYNYSLTILQSRRNSEYSSLARDGKQLYNLYFPNSRIEQKSKYKLALQFFSFALYQYNKTNSTSSLYAHIVKEARKPTGDQQINTADRHYFFTENSLYDVDSKTVIELPEDEAQLKAKLADLAVKAKAQNKSFPLRILFDTRTELASFFEKEPTIDKLDKVIIHLNTLLTRYFKISLPDVNALFEDGRVRKTLFKNHIIPHLRTLNINNSIGSETLKVLAHIFTPQGEAKTTTFTAIADMQDELNAVLPTSMLSRTSYTKYLSALSSKKTTKGGGRVYKNAPSELVLSLLVIAIHNLEQPFKNEYELEVNKKLLDKITSANSNNVLKQYLAQHQDVFTAVFENCQTLPQGKYFQQPKELLKTLCNLFSIPESHKIRGNFTGETYAKPDIDDDDVVAETRHEEPTSTVKEDEAPKFGTTATTLWEIRSGQTSSHASKIPYKINGNLPMGDNWYGEENEITFGNIKTHGDVAGIGGSRLKPGFTSNHEL